MDATVEEIDSYALFAVRERRARQMRESALPWASPRPGLILRFLADRQSKWPPTLREVADHADIPSTSTVAYWYQQLRRAGYVTYEDGLTRTIQLTPEGEAMARS